jgi:acyl-CoA reductase-like NAD-dependent aldehyde dehydrogenase
MSGAELLRVEAGAIEGRARNLRSRQQQLQSLFDHLTARSDELAQAIKTETPCLLHEAQVAVAAMLLELRKHYDRLDLKAELTTEYKSKKGHSCPERRIATRIVYIIPDSAFLAFSVFTALCAVIEAGSCCVVEVRYQPIFILAGCGYS